MVILDPYGMTFDAVGVFGLDYLYVTELTHFCITAGSTLILTFYHAPIFMNL